MTCKTLEQGTLVLEDGTVLRGNSFGAKGSVLGEIVFNTSMVGYQEILTDPSYANQMIVMTYPEIGNYGLNNDDFESLNPACKGFIVKNFCRYDSHYKSVQNLKTYLKDKGVVAIEGLDTRSITKKIREAGVMNCLMTTDEVNDNNIGDKLAELSSYKADKDVVMKVTTSERYVKGESGQVNVALIDYGCKDGIVDSLVERGCKVNVFEAGVSSDEILNGDYDCVFLSNGPGDPSDCTFELETIKNLVGKIPVFGICLGYQLLSIVLGAKTYKLKYGHRGANHPVINLENKKVMVTSQNHGYAVDMKSLTGIMKATYKNLNDETLEGFSCLQMKIYAVQFHPEANPGPTDAAVIFDEWVALMKGFKKAPVRKAQDILNV